MTPAALLFLLLGAWRGLLGRSPCCGAAGMLGGGLRAGRCPGCGTDLSAATIDGAVPLLAGLATATAGLGTAFLIAVHLAPDHPALLPAALAASLGTAAMALPRIAGGLTGWHWALLQAARGVAPLPSRTAPRPRVGAALRRARPG